ncbi:PREDICTED: uncharacterized protein LOC104607109 [Nelumbo nucifera]|uniref:Uncharacterized protein LOC104607109 n=2 Tax=Nelumbo nucifera TaxID=4432 RepID=A0A1U8ASY5_NELNU|nr:PREDICTED: uncharacterized protein LOC104607109 [Nelumbo nucifera]DAD38401.1 TPA_asm: hypothetical protein HUJ06_009042 [Nelumbo nucifera]
METSLMFAFVIELLISALYLAGPVRSLLPACRNLCGGIAVDYPFGIDDGCGAPQYRKMLNCSGAGLFFLTPSGSYRVRSIDYEKKTMVIYDPAMSTCTVLQTHHDLVMSEIQSVVIPPSSDTIFALVNCSVDSPVLNHYRSLCFNFSGHSCNELYDACTSFRMFRMLSNGYPPCCFTSYSTVRLMSMNILDCSHYTSVYNTDNLRGVGPLDWSYGMKLSYTVADTGCQRCQRSGSTCGFDTETEVPLCLCSTTANSTRECSGINATGGGVRPNPLALFQLFVLGASIRFFYHI